MRSSYRLSLALLISLVFVLPARAERWWSTGHGHITEAAIGHLPQPLRGYFEENGSTLASWSGNEPPGQHWIDIDGYPEFFTGTLPRQRAELEAIYGASYVASLGLGPWNACDLADQLTDQMATADTEAAWYALLHTAAQLAHYVEDLHNPLHLTLNYDGQLTGNDGIHARYEGSMINGHLGDLTLTANPSACVYHSWLGDVLFDSFDTNFYYSYDIMAADDDAVLLDPRHGGTYYAALWADTGGFTHTLFQDASEMVASAWYSAWIDAGSPTPVPEPGSLMLLAGAALVAIRRRR